MNLTFCHFWRLYYENRHILPDSIDGLITRFYHFSAGIPYIGERPPGKVFGDVEIVPFKYHSCAAFCVSTTLELSWGWRYGKTRGDWKAFPPLARRNVPILSEISEKYDIPISWAVIGHLFLDKCEKDEKGFAHCSMPRPNGFYETHQFWDWKNGDWYQHDPCSSFEKDPLWYAPDLIREIADNPVKHEIGTHSFSHIDFSHPSCTPELARRELEKCTKVMETYSLTPRSMVFPGGLIGYLDILSASGIIAYQGGLNKCTYPERKEGGLWNINGSLFLGRGRGYDYLKRAKAIIDKAIDNNLAFNFVLSDPMFYPSEHADTIRQNFENVLLYARDCRSKGKLWIATLSEIAGYCEARESAEIVSERKENEIKIRLRSSLNHQRFGNPEISLKIQIPNKSLVKRIEYGDKEVVLGSTKCFSLTDENALILTVPVSTKNVRIQMKGQKADHEDLI